MYTAGLVLTFMMTFQALYCGIMHLKQLSDNQLIIKENATSQKEEKTYFTKSSKLTEQAKMTKVKDK